MNRPAGALQGDVPEARRRQGGHGKIQRVESSCWLQTPRLVRSSGERRELKERIALGRAAQA